MEIVVTFLPVGGGDSAVITFSENGSKKCIVIDGGEDKQSRLALCNYLEKHDVTTVNLMIATHIDADHIQGLNLLTKELVHEKQSNGKPSISIENYWGPMSDEVVPEKMSIASFVSLMQNVDELGIESLSMVALSQRQNNQLYENVRDLGADIYIPSLEDPPPLNIFDNIKIDFLAPPKQVVPKTKIASLDESLFDKNYEMIDLNKIDVVEALRRAADDYHVSANNQSIVCRLTPKEWNGNTKAPSFLFTGDAEKESWHRMLDSPRVRNKLKANILKVPHHGSKNGLIKEALEIIDPEFCIISAGENKHGIPDSSLFSMMNQLFKDRNKQLKLLCTGRNIFGETSMESISPKYRDRIIECTKVSKEQCPVFAQSRAREITFTVDTKQGTVKNNFGNKWCLHDW